MPTIISPALSDEITEILDILNEIDPNPQAYQRHLEILLDNMDENIYYSWAKNELNKYIQLLKKTWYRTAEESDTKQGLYRKLRKWNVIPDSVTYITGIPWKSGDVVILSKLRTAKVLDGK